MKRLLIAAALLAGVATTPALAAGSVIETYYAYLGEADHYNSNGEQLTQPWQIIRQDRANVHRYGIVDDGDEGDSFFDNANNRARMEQMLIKAHYAPGVRNMIVNNEVFIRVDIIGYGNRFTSVQVSLP